MTEGEGRIATVAEIVTHPDQAELASPAQLAPKARELSHFGYLPLVFAWRHSIECHQSF